MEWTILSMGPPRRKRGPVANFLRDIAQHLPGHRFPPYLVMLDLLARGRVGGGMSGEITWSATSTDLDRDAYAKALDANAYVESEPRGSTNYEQWVAATYEDRFGWPYEDHVRLLEEIRSIELVVSDDPSDENRNAYLKASQALADFVNHSCAVR